MTLLEKIKVKNAKEEGNEVKGIVVTSIGALSPGCVEDQDIFQDDVPAFVSCGTRGIQPFPFINFYGFGICMNIFM